MSKMESSRISAVITIVLGSLIIGFTIGVLTTIAATPKADLSPVERGYMYHKYRGLLTGVIYTGFEFDNTARTSFFLKLWNVSNGNVVVAKFMNLRGLITPLKIGANYTVSCWVQGKEITEFGTEKILDLVIVKEG